MILDSAAAKGVTPRLTSGKPKVAVDDATTMSQLTAISYPPQYAGPFTAAITGLLPPLDDRPPNPFSGSFIETPFSFFAIHSMVLLDIVVQIREINTTYCGHVLIFEISASTERLSHFADHSYAKALLLVKPSQDGVKFITRFIR